MTDRPGPKSDRPSPESGLPNPKSFLLDIDEEYSIAQITLNRPEKLNALTFQVYEELIDTFRALHAAPEVRAVVITGAGRGFCTGGDVEEIIGPLLERDYQELVEFTRMTCDLVLAIRRCRKPVVAALHGTVAGAGAVIATACDVRVAAESGRIGFIFTRVGLSGADMGAAWMLPRIVGMGHATELLMTGEFIPASHAHSIGLYNRLTSDEEVVMVATGLAANLARGPSFALEVTKYALDREATMDLEAALEDEARIQAACMLHPNFRKAYETFRDRNKRRPPIEPRFE